MSPSTATPEHTDVTPMPFRELWRTGRGPLVVGVVTRLVLLAFAEPFYGDAPVRLAFAWRLQERPHLGWGWPDVFQFGPLPLHLGALASAVHKSLGPPSVSLVAGTLAILLAMRLASRFTPSDSASIRLVGWLVALGPLHLQASTTFVSEMMYLAAALALVEATLSGHRGLAFVALFAASTSRYDLWLVLPAWVLLWAFLRGPSFRKLLEAALLAAPGPLSILVANAVSVGDPLRPLTVIRQEHVRLGQLLDSELGPFVGRVRGVLFWVFVLVVVLGPVAGAWVWRDVRGRFNDRATWPLWLVGWGPPAVYLLRALLTNGFFPMSRLAIVPGTLLAAMTPWSSPRLRAFAVGSLVLLDLSLVTITLVGDAEGARIVSTTSPLSRWPDDLRVARGWLAQAPDSTEVESVGDFEELVLLVDAGHSNPHAFVLEPCGVPKPFAIVRAGGVFDPGERPSTELGTRRATSGRFVHVERATTAPRRCVREGAGSIETQGD